MVFSSTVFLFLFFPLVLALYYNPVIGTRRFRNIVLLLASLFFYAWGEPVFVFLMIISIVITWYLAILIKREIRYDNSTAKWILGIGVAYHIIVLFIFKYLTFVAQQLGLLLHKDFSFISIGLPIGISFFTFQLMSYLFDIYYEKAPIQENLFYMALYIALFPQLIAGPIVRYEQVAAEINDRTENLEDVLEGMKRFIYGLSKKVILSNYLAVIADNIFDHTGDGRSVMTAWLGAICYTLQIYFDFSGYSDMAIGLGRIFGFHFTENFNYPYIAKSVTDFWRRWHISLSSWFRDYVYIPLGGNRVSRLRWIGNLFVVWALTGIWHGANWTFLAWGLFYFVILVIEKLTGFAEKIWILSRVYTIIIVIIAWVFFRAVTIQDGIYYLGNMFNIGATGFMDSFASHYITESGLVIVVSMVLCLPLYPMIAAFLKKHSLEWIDSLLALALLLLDIVLIVTSTYNPFIYFNF